MKKLLAVILQPPIPALFGLILLSAIVYYGGGALERWLKLDDATLVSIVIGIWVFAALVFVWRRLQSRKRARLIEDRLRGQAREHRESVRPDKRSQVEELEEQLNTALTTLKSSKLGKNALYELPWYVIIGPPGSGKTTLLRESNLTFPDQAHGRGVRGVGGTRNCDWWFTDQGILLDTAGRYTTQDEDRNEWYAFLEMLKKSRARKPINGAMITISIADIIQSTDEELAEHARKIRERLAELTQRLEVVFPVYLLFSKCDLLEGFVETFGSYGAKERAQIWGFTLPYLKNQDSSIASQFDREIEAIQDRLGAERLHNLATAKSKTKKAKIFSFPLQFAKVRARLRAFLTQLEQPNPYHESSDLRGFYFTSGTQEGQPLDQVLADMRTACGLTEDEASASEDKVEKKAYFIDDLFTQVVFPDKNLAQSSAKAQKRRQTGRRIGMLSTLAVTVLLLVWTIVSYVGHGDLIARAMRTHKAANIPLTSAELDRETSLAQDGGGPLEQLRQMFVELDDARSSMGRLVMGQEEALYSRRIRKLYVQQLKATLLNKLQARLKARLEELEAMPKEELKEQKLVTVFKDALNCYQMLGGKIGFDRQFMQDYLRGDRWTWDEDGKEVLAALPHRETFLDRVAVAPFTDWHTLAEEGLIGRAESKWRGSDGVAETVDKLRNESGETEAMAIEDVVTHADAKLFEIGVPQCYVNETSFDDAFEKQAERAGDDSAESLKERYRKDGIKAWRQSLFDLRPPQRLNLKEACEQLSKLTSEPEDSFYVTYYELVCERLTRLEEDCTSTDDQAWLPDTLKAIGAVAEAAKPLVSKPSTMRIIPSIEGKLVDEVLTKIGDARSTIGTRSKEAPRAIQNSIAKALTSLLESFTTALAYEIVVEANNKWASGVGKTLAEFNKRFPFADMPEEVDPGAFEDMFKDGGEFDTALSDYVQPLQGYLDALGEDRKLEAHVKDREKANAIFKALFRGEVGCEIDFVMTKPDKTTSVTFQLGDNEPNTAKRRTRLTLQWHPKDKAMIRINEFLTAGPGTGVDATKEERDSWGFLRLLSRGIRGTANLKNKEGEDVEYQQCTWNDFQRKEENLAATMTLLFKTSSQPNPLHPDFFMDYRFSTKVFRHADGIASEAGDGK